MNTEDPNGAAWLARLRATLDADAEGLDPEARRRLASARRRALEVRPAFGVPLFARAAVATLALAALVAVWRAPTLGPAADGVVVEAPAAIEARDLELVAAGELELYEDWEFYAWLDAQSVEG